MYEARVRVGVLSVRFSDRHAYEARVRVGVLSVRLFLCVCVYDTGVTLSQLVIPPNFPSLWLHLQTVTEHLCLFFFIMHKKILNPFQRRRKTNKKKKRKAVPKGSKGSPPKRRKTGPSETRRVQPFGLNLDALKSKEHQNGKFKPLAENGFQHFKGVVSPKECQRIELLMWKYMESLGIGIEMKDPSTYDNFKKIPNNHGGLLQRLGVGQCTAVWAARLNKEVIRIFSELWGVPPEDLVVSFDGMFFGFAGDHRTGEGSFRPYRKGGKNWRHFDAGPHRAGNLGQNCPQAILCVGDMPAEGTTLEVWEKSHLVFDEFCATFPTVRTPPFDEKRAGKYKTPEHEQAARDRANKDVPRPKKDWIKVTPEEEQWIKDHPLTADAPTRANAKRGDLLMWLSSVLHQGVGFQEGFSKSGVKIPARRAIYVSYVPRSMVSESILAKRQPIVGTGTTCSHWATKIKKFPEADRYKDMKIFPFDQARRRNTALRKEGKPEVPLGIPEADWIHMDPLMRRLIGCDE